MKAFVLVLVLLLPGEYEYQLELENHYTYGQCIAQAIRYARNPHWFSFRITDYRCKET